MSTEFMTFKTTQLKPFPVGENPFWHDAISCGARLRDCVVLDPNSKNDQKYNNIYVMYGGTLAEGFYLVNTDTGERIKIEVV